MRIRLFSFILITIIISPFVAHAAPLCSDGSLAPGGNICNCASAYSIGGGSTFTPGAGSSLTGNTYSGLQFSGVGNALASCLNIGGAISKIADKIATNVGMKVPTNDSVTGSATQGSQAELKKTTLREQCLNGAAQAVAKTAIQTLSNKTLTWVRTGFNGNPLYVRDIDSYLTSIRNEKSNDYINNYIATNNPIFGNALRSVLKQQTTGFNDGLLNKAMNTPQGRAYQDFQSDFTKGGWDAFLNPNYNPIGAYFKATDELGSSINNAQQNVKQELLQGNGFLSMKKCVEYADTKPGSTPAPASTPSGPMTITQSGADAATAGARAAATPPKCIRYETTTPGSIISQQVSTITNSTLRQLENTTKINQVLGSFFDELMNRLFTDGLTGSSKGTSRTTTGGGIGLNVVLGANGQTLASANACQTPLGYDPTTGGFNQEFDISRPQQLRAVIVTQKNFLTRSQDAQFIMQQLVPKIGALDYCIPGPNPTWNNNLNENAQAFAQGLQPFYRTIKGKINVLQHFVDPLGITGRDDTVDREVIAGYNISRWSLFDKVDFGQKRISDRGYATNEFVSQAIINNYFDDIFQLLKKKYTALFPDTAIISAFASIARTPSDVALFTGDAKDSLKEVSNLVGFSQGIAAYNEQYKTNIQNTQEALVELETIDAQVEKIVATAKARYIGEQKDAGTPVKLSCIDNAYRLGPIPAGIPHIENITATPDPMIQKSLESSTYFYNHL